MNSSNKPRKRSYFRFLTIFMLGKFTDSVLPIALKPILQAITGMDLAQNELKRARRKKLLSSIKPNYIVVVFFLGLSILSLIFGVLGVRLIEGGGTSSAIYGNYLLNISTELLGAALLFMLLDFFYNHVMTLHQEAQRTADSDLQNAELRYVEAQNKQNKIVFESIGLLTWKFHVDMINAADTGFFYKIPSDGWYISSKELFQLSPDVNQNSFIVRSAFVRSMGFHIFRENDFVVIRVVFDDDADYDRVSLLERIPLKESETNSTDINSAI